MNYAVPVLLNYTDKFDNPVCKQKIIYMISCDNDLIAEKRAWELSQKSCDEHNSNSEISVKYNVEAVEKPYQITENLSNESILYSETY